MITRDLVAPTTAALGKAMDPTTLSSMRVGGGTGSTLKVPGSTLRVPSGATIDVSALSRKVRLFIIIAIASFIGICLLGFLALIPAMVGGFQSGVDEATSEPTVEPGGPAGQAPERSATNLHSPAGWSALVDAIESASGTTAVYDAVIYPQYASIGLDDDGAVERRFYRDGNWQDSVSVRTPAVGEPVDLGEIDPEIVAGLPAETAAYFDLDAPTGAYLIVNAHFGGPKIMVYVQSDGGSQFRQYGLDGQPLN